jgi:hypothetical protein
MSTHHLIMLSASVPGRWGYIGRKFFSQKLRAPTAAGPFLRAHLLSLAAYSPRQARIPRA